MYLRISMVTNMKQKRNLMLLVLTLALEGVTNMALAEEVIELDGKAVLTSEEVKDSLFPKDNTGCDPIEAAKAKMTCMGFTPAPKVFSLPSGLAFAVGSATLSSQAQSYLSKFGSTVRSLAGTDLRIMISGHTDASGSKSVNERLSMQRAEAVKAYLVKAYGAPPANLISVGLADSKLRNPAQPNAAENRRVEISR